MAIVLKKSISAAPAKVAAPVKKEKKQASSDKPRSPKEIALMLLVEQHKSFIEQVESGEHNTKIVSLVGRSVRDTDKLLGQVLTQLRGRSERMLLAATKLLDKRGLL